MVIDKMLVDQMEVAFMASSFDDDLALILNCLIPVSLLESTNFEDYICSRKNGSD